MNEKNIKEAIELLEARGEKPSVRAVRSELGGKGSHTDIAAAVRKIMQERSRLKSVESEIPASLQDKISLMTLDSAILKVRNF